jgi:hypothetical protein
MGSLAGTRYGFSVVMRLRSRPIAFAVRRLDNPRHREG